MIIGRAVIRTVGGEEGVLAANIGVVVVDVVIVI
jgi:hypothetical protein